MFNVKDNQIIQRSERYNYSKDGDTPRVHIKNTGDMRIFSKRVRFYSQPAYKTFLGYGGLRSILEFPLFLPLQRAFFFFLFSLNFRSQFLPGSSVSLNLITSQEVFVFVRMHPNLLECDKRKSDLQRTLRSRV